MIYGQDDLLGVAAAVRELLARMVECDTCPHAVCGHLTCSARHKDAKRMRSIPVAELLKQAEVLARAKLLRSGR